ncbi:helix-turn-helix domain-containing protein [Lentzea flaviverrucosa]|nr:helix-turn-helix domain-containing protein [Lentzea flaviverrucosa]
MDRTSSKPDRNGDEDDGFAVSRQRDESARWTTDPRSSTVSDAIKEVLATTVRLGHTDDVTARHAVHSMLQADLGPQEAGRVVNEIASTMVDELIAAPGGSRLSAIRRVVELMSSAAELVVTLHRRIKDAELVDRTDLSPLVLHPADVDDLATPTGYEDNCLYVLAARGALPEGDQLYRELVDLGAGAAITEISTEGFFAVQRMNNRQAAERMCRSLLSRLPAATVMAVEPLVFGGPLESFKTVEGLLRLAFMFDLGPGLYQISDFPVEFAVATTAPVREKLLAMIQPVMAKAELRRTLELLVFSQGNRTRAAERLNIHRSTIDYRLNQIDKLTGHSPVTTGGLNMLTLSLAVRTLMA